MKNQKYNNYFKNQYHSTFSDLDIENSQKWLYAQWLMIKNIVGKNVLEIGSGTGGFYSFAKKSVNKYTGLELDKQAVNFCNTYFKTNVFLNTPIEKYHTKNKFDTIMAFEVLEHLDDPMGTIKKIQSLLKVGGVFIGTSPYPYRKNIYADKTHLYVLNPENWIKLFADAGFSKIYTKPLSFFPFLWRINKYLNIRIPFYIPFKFFISTTLIIAYK